MAFSNKTTSSLALFFCLNLLFFSLVTARSPCSAPVPEPTQSPNSVVTPPTAGGGPVVGLPTDGAPTPTTGRDTCPRSSTDISACANLLSTIGLILNMPPANECCSLIDELVDIEAAVCLCASLKLALLPMRAGILLSVNVLLNSCKRDDAPSNYQCAY